MKYAHQKKLYHRALCPQNILVRDVATSLPRLQIMNWQTGTRDATTGGTGIRTVGTLHVEEYVEDRGRIYLAPESTWGEPAQGPHLDVFSLGAIAYHLFSGQAPADSVVESHEKLRVGPGLWISDVMDGAGKGLQDLIQFSTIPDASVRYATVDDFLKALEEVEDELTAPDPEVTVDPSVATKGDLIECGFTVLGRIGKGSSSGALLVKADGSDEELVLKVASDIAHNERLVAEGEVLAKLRYPNVVELRRTLTVSGRTALLMQKAGEKTLAQRLRDDTCLSLDLLRRFGEELIQTVEHLEDQGVVHRDIKPENIGISQAGAKGRPQRHGGLVARRSDRRCRGRAPVRRASRTQRQVGWFPRVDGPPPHGVGVPVTSSPKWARIPKPGSKTPTGPATRDRLEPRLFTPLDAITNKD
ncbi:MAG: protein kinase domain-containing protein [Gammaproteobacteria bacterium]